MPTKPIRLLVVITLLAVKRISSLTFSTKNHLHLLKNLRSCGTRHLESRNHLFVWTRTQIPSTTPYLGSFKRLLLDDGEILESKRQVSSSKQQHHSKTNKKYDAPKIAKAAKDGKPELAESLFLRMLQEYTKNKKGEKPSPKLLTMVLNAWTKQPRSKMKAAPERAEALLKKVEQDLQVFGALGIKPNAICYNCVINCWAKSGRTDAPEAMLKLLLTMMLQLSFRIL